MKIKQYFEPEPEKWGLRGDPIMWQKLSLLDISGNLLDEIKKEIYKYFDINGEAIYIAELATGGGMSEGWVSPRWWREVGLPLLNKRINNQ